MYFNLQTKLARVQMSSVIRTNLVLLRAQIQVFSSWKSSTTRDEGLAVVDGWQGLPGISELWTDKFSFRFSPSKNQNLSSINMRGWKPGARDRWQLGREVEGRRGKQWQRAGNCCNHQQSQSDGKHWFSFLEIWVPNKIHPQGKNTPKIEVGGWIQSN